MIRYASSDPLMGVLNRRVIWGQGQQYLAEPSQVDGDFAGVTMAAIVFWPRLQRR